ncbi:helix-turn-helix domain-containing protein [Nostoc sp.]
MGKAGKALKQVLEKHGISQNKLAVTMRTGRSNVNRWVNEMMNPVAEGVL